MTFPELDHFYKHLSLDTKYSVTPCIMGILFGLMGVYLVGSVYESESVL